MYSCMIFSGKIFQCLLSRNLFYVHANPAFHKTWLKELDIKTGQYRTCLYLKQVNMENVYI